MNERIQKLAEQAGMKSPDGFKLTVSHMTTFQLEKFAELIVKECARVAERTGALNDADWSEMIAAAVKEHFGVEE